LKFASLFIFVSCASKTPLGTTSVLNVTEKDIRETLSNSVTIKGGPLLLGPRAFLDEGDQKQVDVKSFRVMKTEVTQLQWTYIMKSNPSKFKTVFDCSNHATIDGVEVCPDLPVESVTKIEVDEFITKLNKKLKTNFRLPNEFEWEKSVESARVHNLQMEEDESLEYSLFGNDEKKTVSVKSRKPIENGLYLTGGNVWEITSSKYNKFSFSNIKKESHKNTFVIKGGGWNSRFDHLRRAYRGSWPAKLRSQDVGLRLVSNK
jgi:formylglycine-generating enzyme required for sulfatase activity